MNGYVCFYRSKRVEVHAETSYGAQQLALTKFQAIFPRNKVRGSDIAVTLAEKNGEQVVHLPLF